MSSSSSSAQPFFIATIEVDAIDFEIVSVDTIDFEGINFMDAAKVTTGLKPKVLGSAYTFQLQPRKNGLPWDLTGGSAVLYLADPSGTVTTIPAAIVGRGAMAAWVATGSEGMWTRAWKAVDAAGIVQYSPPISFRLILGP